ncbi:MAG TPA: hypothetical protein VGG13_00460 [Candidatus Saccharimonadales bacterium]|jgi:hypothetical protein
MWKYFDPIAGVVFFFVIFSIDAVVYYSQGRHHSLIPLVICGAATVIVGVIAGMAIHEIFKHRNDKESW